jgi:hypothetical protein
VHLTATGWLILIAAPLGLWLTLDAGTFIGVDVNLATHAVRVGLSKSDEYTPQGRLRVQQPAKISGVGTFHPRPQLELERDAYVIGLKESVVWIELVNNTN